MPDPITIGAVGWGVSAVGWLVSPIITRLLNKGFAHLDFNASEKLKILDTQVLQLQRGMEIIDESTYRIRLEPLLDKLKSALYEAEDILDRVQYKSLKKQIQDAKSKGGKMDLVIKNLRTAWPCPPLTDKDTGVPKYKLEESLNNIGRAISDASEVLEQLKLPGVYNDNRRKDVATNSRTAVTTAGPPLRVIGRDQEREKIIAMLHEKEDQCQANTVTYSVIGIHGLAGSGKSTLAQCVYAHEKKQEKIDGNFDIFIWIHVSQKFSLYSIFSEMLEGVTQKEAPKFLSLNVLKESLEKELRGKRILLVLDDVWFKIDNLEDREELQKLISPLNVGVGSRILVTSRTEAALVALGAVKERCLPISDLDDKLFLEMFMHYALRDARVSDQDRGILEIIGEDIAKKLKRSPLAARTVGSRLHDNLNIRFWRSEKNRDLLNNTMGALWWSYQYLDEQVRWCFTYCSIFPRGHRFKRDELVKLWVAEGFIRTSNPEEEMEDVANNYFDELLSASFLQLGGIEWSHEASDPARGVNYFTIHDLLCDLAEEVAGRDCFRIEKGCCTGEVPQDVRYLFVGAYNREMFAKKISKLKNLRTLIIADEIQSGWKALEIMFTMLTGLRKLRVLKIRISSDSRDSFSFPDSIGKWKHLRYFAFMVHHVTSLTLPAAFAKLYHMQVVHFGRCSRLAFSSDEDMMNLVNLRCVISRANLDFSNVGRLTWLQMLPIFEIKKKQGYESHQLKHLNRIQDCLQIYGLENIQCKEEALEANLAGKEKLTELVLSWETWNNKSCSPEVQAEVLEGLCPPKYLKRLHIRRYHGMKSPIWMMGKHKGGPKNLQELHFSQGSQRGPAPDLGAFVRLHLLYLETCSWDALPGDMEHLTLLKILQIRACMNIRSLTTLPKSLEHFIVDCCNHEFMRSCITTDDENCQRIEHIPMKMFKIYNLDRRNEVVLRLGGAEEDGAKTVQFLQTIQDIISRAM